MNSMSKSYSHSLKFLLKQKYLELLKVQDQPAQDCWLHTVNKILGFTEIDFDGSNSVLIAKDQYEFKHIQSALEKIEKMFQLHRNFRLFTRIQYNKWVIAKLNPLIESEYDEYSI